MPGVTLTFPAPPYPPLLLPDDESYCTLRARSRRCRCTGTGYRRCKLYVSANEHEKRAEIYAGNVAYMNEHNAKYAAGEVTFYLGTLK